MSSDRDGETAPGTMTPAEMPPSEDRPAGRRSGADGESRETASEGPRLAGEPTGNDPATRRLDRSPAPLSSAVATGAALLALLASGTASTLALLLAVLGAGTIVTGLGMGRRGAVTVGAAVLFLAGLAAGVAGAPPARLLVAVAGPVLAWDVGRNAIDVGAQLGHAASTARIELLHAGVSVLVVSMTAALGLGVFRAVAGGQPAVAVAGLVLAGALLSYALG